MVNRTRLKGEAYLDMTTIDKADFPVSLFPSICLYESTI